MALRGIDAWQAEVGGLASARRPLVDAAIWIHQGKDQKPLTTKSDDPATRVPYCRRAGAHRASGAVAALLRDRLIPAGHRLVAATFVIFAVSGSSLDNPPRGHLNRELFCARSSAG